MQSCLEAGKLITKDSVVRRDVEVDLLHSGVVEYCWRALILIEAAHIAT